MSEQRQDNTAQAAEIVKGYRPIEQLLPSHWSEEVMVANGIHIHYFRTGGAKPPMLLLHGLMDGALAWLRAALVLQQDYDVLMPDFRGHGLSERFSGNFSTVLLMEDTASFIRTLGLPSVRVLGFSLGSSVGIHLAATYSELVQSLIVAGVADEQAANPRADGASTDMTASPSYMAWFNTWLSWLEQLKTQTHEERMLSALSQQMPGAPLPGEVQYVTSVENAARLDLDLVRHGLTMWSEVGAEWERTKQAMEHITCPMLIMKSGMFAQPGVPLSVEEAASDRPNVKIVRFVNAGHTIDRDHFEPFMALVQEFFKAH